MVLKSVQLASALSWRGEPDGICCRRRRLKSIDICLALKSMDSMETMVSVQIRLSLFISLVLINTPHVNRAGSEGNICRPLIGSLSCRITQRHRLPLQCAYQSVQPFPCTRQSSVSPFFLQPISIWPFLLSLFDSL